VTEHHELHQPRACSTLPRDIKSATTYNHEKHHPPSKWPFPSRFTSLEEMILAMAALSLARTPSQYFLSSRQRTRHRPQHVLRSVSFVRLAGLPTSVLTPLQVSSNRSPVATFDWGLNGGFGVAAIGNRQMPMAHLVQPGSSQT